MNFNQEELVAKWAGIGVGEGVVRGNNQGRGRGGAMEIIVLQLEEV